jgi:hypothetical protein
MKFRHHGVPFRIGNSIEIHHRVADPLLQFFWQLIQKPIRRRRVEAIDQNCDLT